MYTLSKYLTKTQANKIRLKLFLTFNYKYPRIAFFANSRGRICRYPYQAERRDLGGSTASAAPFVTNPIDVSRSYSHSRALGRWRVSIPHS